MHILHFFVIYVSDFIWIRRKTKMDTKKRSANVMKEQKTLLLQFMKKIRA